jgi:hypothetical protein
VSNHLQRLRLAWDQADGPRLINLWKNPLEVGSPLHVSQSFEDETGRVGLVVVTQPPRRAACWATCVDDETGDVRWQRQLGLVCDREPVSLAAPGEKPILLVTDQGGSLFSLDPTRYPVKKGDQWLIDSKPVQLAGSLDENLDQPPVVLVAPDGQSAYVIACPGDGRSVVVRHVTVKPKERRLHVKENRVPIPAPLIGMPAIVGSRLLLPLAGEEKLVRLPLPLPREVPDPQQGPDWRGSRAAPDAPGYIVHLGQNRFLTTDGLRQLRVWDWSPDRAFWGVLPLARGENPTLEMKDRIVAPPLRLPGKPNDLERLCIADAGGNLNLLEMLPDGRLEIRQTWQLGGIVTAGPFVRMVGDALRVGCVVDRSKLVWIDPSADKELWTYATEKGDAIVGQPQLAAGMVVLADQSGRYVGLDPKTGTPAGATYQLRGSISPATCPMPFHDDRLLAPLSDGTLLLLSVKRLQSPPSN